MKQMLKLALTLFLITAIVAGVLAGVNLITKPLIEKSNQEKILVAVEKVLPGGGEKLDIALSEGISQVYASEKGYAVLVESPGFGGTIQMMVGVDKAGKVLGISVISQSETAGLGAVVAANNTAGEAFRNQYVIGQAPYALGSNIDALTGATITSKAVTNGVNLAVSYVREVLE